MNFIAAYISIGNQATWL